MSERINRPTILTTRQVADALGVSPARVRQVAIAHAIGVKLHERERVFTPDDLEQVRQRIRSSLGRS